MERERSHHQRGGRGRQRQQERALRTHAGSTGMGFSGSFLGFGFSGWMMAAVTLVLEFGAHEDIPMRLALTTTVEGGVSSVGPILVGLSIAALGYAPLIVAAFAALIGSLALMLWRVREPRGSA